MSMMLSNEGVDIALDAFCTALASGFLRFYDGTRPANPNVAITTQAQLAELKFAAVPFQPSIDGTALSYHFVLDANTAAGSAVWARALRSDGVTVMFDCDISTSGSDINLNTIVITATGIVSESESGFSFAITFPKGW
jgi:hypothetical protein